MLPYLLYYLIFLTVVSLLYYSVNERCRHYVLFAASLLFIAAFSLPVALFSLAFTTLNYFLGLLLDRFKGRPALKNKIFWLGIVADVGILAFFKYINIFFENINSPLSLTAFDVKMPYLTLLIPLGISYYTFQALGYLILISRGSEQAERNYARFATFLLFFPKFLSGPVERSGHFFPQIKSPGAFDRDKASSGLRLLLWGAFKKIVIANNLYEPVSNVYNDIYSYTGISLIIVLFIQVIYIYFDFSGYTDMALGSAKIFGIDLIDNFKRPFLAKNVSEFWKRWHISLSSWCNDFIFIPFIVKFRKWGNTAAVAGIFLTFFIIGVWHGANWTFVVLGILQGIAVVYEFYTKKIRFNIAARLPQYMVNTLGRFFVFLFMAVSMVFFYANSLTEALYFISHLFSDIKSGVNVHGLIANRPAFLLAIACFILIFIVEMLNERGKGIMPFYLKQPWWVRWAGYFIGISLIYLSGSGIESFYYMRF
ncbi:Probable poly(beta-D-mannuronate) O-acetylase [hydrothermal vent metagenome]|uniref:Probable poly(Beta-D-mannuronate) O-acetylase n=1 Tax=hydrothermal vent metagenome TaxID=652676 RepID=A0A3B0TZZ3_9ZZZZ